MPKPLSLPGLYIIKKINFTPSVASGKMVAVFSVIDSYSQKHRLFRFDSDSIATTPEKTRSVIETFIRSGQLNAPCHLDPLPTPAGYSQNLTLACFSKLRNQPCLVRYQHLGQNIGMLFYPHEFSF